MLITPWIFIRFIATWYVNVPLYALYLCQISIQWSYKFVFIAIFVKCTKRKIEAPVAPYGKEKKNREIKMKLWSLIFQQWVGRFPSNLVCGVAYLAGTSVVKLVLIR